MRHLTFQVPRHALLNGLLLGALVLPGCSISDIVGDAGALPGTTNPDAVKSLEGATNLYRGVIASQAFAVSQFVMVSGLFTDELRIPQLVEGQKNVTDQRFPEDAGTNSADSKRLFTALNDVRINARVARSVVQTYGAVLPSAVSGHLYAMEAMAVLMLADLYCSGVPLSLVNSDGSQTLRSGISTTTLYRVAEALFDSAITLSSDSVRIRSFAQLGKGRALLALGEYAAAELAVRDIPQGWVYEIEYRSRSGVSGNGFARTQGTVRNGAYSVNVTVSDREGGNGLPFVTSGDPRTDTAPGVTQDASAPYRSYVARKYSDIDGNTPIVLGSHIEARLIEAEAALRNSDTVIWLRMLNTLRTNCISGGSCPVPALTGSGGMAGLSLLRDPGTEPLPVGRSATDVRVDLLFAERAYWLFLTGRRQGDLRRLIRNYERSEDTVYPTGDFPFATQNGQSYGTDVTLPVPADEFRINPHFQGCISREA